MGNYSSVHNMAFPRLPFRLSGYKSSREQFKVALLGLDSAGKTSILNRLRLHESRRLIPTIGFNMEDVLTENGWALKIWDCGGQERVRAQWAHFLYHTDGLLYVVDSADRDALRTARRELHRILAYQHVRQVPLVVVANKQDLPAAMPMMALVDCLRLTDITERAWHILPTSATNNMGIMEAVNKLTSMVQARKRQQLLQPQRQRNRQPLATRPRAIQTRTPSPFRRHHARDRPTRAKHPSTTPTMTLISPPGQTPPRSMTSRTTPTAITTAASPAVNSALLTK